jgi:hypothetical protein
MVRLCYHRPGREPVSVRPAFALSLLIRVHLRFHFLAPGAHRRPVWRRNAKLKKAVRTVPCVAGSSARHWLNDQSNQRDIGMPIENSSRLAVIPRLAMQISLVTAARGSPDQPRSLLFICVHLRASAVEYFSLYLLELVCGASAICIPT